MTSADCLRQVVDALDKSGLPFMVVGSLSSNFYGVARSTRDADFVIQLDDRPIASLATALPSGFVLDSQIGFETVTGTTKFRLTHRDSEFEIELFALSTDAHDRECFGRRVKQNIEGRRVFVPTAEDVIVTKLRWAKSAKRSKDIEDIRGVLAVQLGRLDLEYIRRWTDVHGTRDLFEQLLAK